MLNSQKFSFDIIRRFILIESIYEERIRSIHERLDILFKWCCEIRFLIFVIGFFIHIILLLFLIVEKQRFMMNFCMARSQVTHSHVAKIHKDKSRECKTFLQGSLISNLEHKKDSGLECQRIRSKEFTLQVKGFESIQRVLSEKHVFSHKKHYSKTYYWE